MARGRPAAHHGSGGVRRRLHCCLGHHVWSACHCDDWQRQAVFFSIVVYPVSEAQHSTHRDNRVPPSEQWDGWADTSPAQRRVTGAAGRTQVARTSPLGVIRPQSRAQGGQQPKLVFGMPLTLPGQLLAVAEKPVEKVVEELRAMKPLPTRQLSCAEAASGLQQLQEAEFVYVRRGGVVLPLSPFYQGPYRVLERSQKFLILEVGGRTEVVSVDRLKPHLGKAPLSPALPPQRGRPQGLSPVAASSWPCGPYWGGPLWRRECAKGKWRNPPV
jgi:hypothetical protein